MINNFSLIDKFLQFEEGTFYKFELLKLEGVLLASGLLTEEELNKGI